MKKILTFMRPGSDVFGKIEISLLEKGSPYPHLDIDLNDCKSYLELSIVGEMKNCQSESCGQNYNDFKYFYNDYPELPGIVDIWKRWHLNGLNAGTRIQTEFILTKFSFHRDEALPYYDYNAVVAELKKADLYVDRGYVYGTAWLVEQLPQEVIDKVKSL